MNLLENRTFFLWIIFSWGILLYLPSFNIQFINDEIAFIERCKAGTPSEFLSLFEQKDFDGIYYRPVGNFLSGVLSYLFEYNHLPYRIFNALLHTLNGIVLFLFLGKLLNHVKNGLLISFFGSLIFLSFPLHDYAVIWHTDLFDRLLFSTYILTLYFILQKNVPVSILLFIVSLLIKEMAFGLPLMIVVLKYFVSRDKKFKNIIIESSPYFILAAIFIIFRLIAFNNNIIAAEGIHYQQGFTSILKNYVLAGGLLIIPVFLREIESFLQNYTMVTAVSVFTVLIIFGYYWYRYRKNDKLFFFFILFVIVTFLPASRLLMRWYLYLPSAGFAALIAYSIFTLPIKIKTSIIILIVSVFAYSAFLIHKETDWITVSHKGRNAVEQLKIKYAVELSQAKDICFTTIPAKVNDIPLFNLAFDRHLKHFISPDKEYYVISKSTLEQFEDTILINKADSLIKMSQLKSNYFISTEDQNSSFKGKQKEISIEIEDSPARVYFTFSQGKFILVRDL